MKTRRFPEDDYTPFGYLDNPYHSGVYNRSGVIRTVPPMSMGFWCRNLPFPYGDGFGLIRVLNYLSFIRPSIAIDGTVFHSNEDFDREQVTLSSRYHSKNIMGYDWTYRDTDVSLRYFLPEEDALASVLELTNSGTKPCTIVLTLSHIYGYPERRWWGCDGFVGRFDRASSAGVSKGFAYGDVFAFAAAGLAPFRHAATASEEDWERGIRTAEGKSTGAANSITPEPIYNAVAYRIQLDPGSTRSIPFALVRDRNEEWAVERLSRVLHNTADGFARAKADDDHFYARAPVLSGDWPAYWRRGWIYHFETIRMNIRPPLGIYKHPWDGMQIHTPRQVLGETMIDCMCLSYGDPDLAKEVIEGTFADAIAPHVPCTREDGSMNMISQDGSECGTSPIWVLIFPTIRSLLARTADNAWIRRLYPHLKAFFEWWTEHRTDAEGWFHVNNSWEAQDGSKRFQTEYDDETTAGANVEGVRTSDLQAAMAQAVRCMAEFAAIAGFPDEQEEWQKRAEWLTATARSMFVDDQFRDFDARTGKPILIPDYHDIMMLTPLAVGIATPEQMTKCLWMFEYFDTHRTHWLEWPSFWYIFNEAAQNAGQRELISRLVAETAEHEYPKLDARCTRPPMVDNLWHMPERFFYRIPGVGKEFWAIAPDNPGGCENYGWGSTMPTLIIRSIAGYRELDNPAENAFLLAPTLAGPIAIPGKRYAIENLQFRNSSFDVSFMLRDGASGILDIELTVRQRSGGRVTVLCEGSDDIVATGTGAVLTVSLAGKCGAGYIVSLD